MHSDVRNRSRVAPASVPGRPAEQACRYATDKARSARLPGTEAGAPHSHGKLFNPHHEIRFPSPRRLVAFELELRQPADELLEHHAQLQACEAGAEAEVRAVAAEGDVRVGLAHDVEAGGGG